MSKFPRQYQLASILTNTINDFHNYGKIIVKERLRNIRTTTTDDDDDDDDEDDDDELFLWHG